MRRAAPRPVATALEALTARLQPQTLLAEIQRAWPAAAGPFADVATPFAERDGTVTIACPQAVWAQELDLMAERVVGRLNEELGRSAVRRLRVQARPVPQPPSEGA
jgi:predicted nucleic acid-binding Zn ribbon protein